MSSVATRTSGAPSQMGSARDTVGAYLSAVGEVDGAAICSYLTERVPRRIAALQGSSCERSLTGPLDSCRQA
jgi:hypothetical protein